ncbi:hypothetical protein ACF0H5_022250 [Mactra antiquata]
MENPRQLKILICCTGSVASIKIPELVDCFIKEHTWTKRGDPVLHIELRKWADILLIAPLDANTLGKIASGICDNLLTCTVRAWDFQKPLYFAPAMNTAMWEHPITSEQIKKLESWGYKQIPVVSKLLVCGDKGAGAMAEVSTIIETMLSVKQHLLGT